MPGAECNVKEMCMNRLIYFPVFLCVFFKLGARSTKMAQSKEPKKIYDIAKLTTKLKQYVCM